MRREGIGAPILHVNADDPEAVVAACEMAADFRHRWHKDVIVDVIGYRRWVCKERLQEPDVLPLGVMTSASVCDGLWAVPESASGASAHPAVQERRAEDGDVCMWEVCIASTCLRARSPAVQAWAQ